MTSTKGKALIQIGTNSTAKLTFSRFHLTALGLATALCVFTYTRLPVSIPEQSSGHQRDGAVAFPEQASTPQLADPLLHPLSNDLALASTRPSTSDKVHTIQQGDTLSGLFAENDIDHATLNAVLEADEELLALDVLQLGNMLRFERSESSGDLLVLSLVVHPGRTIHYRRTFGDSFEFEEEIKPSHWREEVVSTQIHGSFYASANQAGLSDADILQAQRIFEERVNFRRDIQAGDRFEIVFGREMVSSGATGQTRIEALRLHLGRRVHSAYLHDDGNYYDQGGESLSRAFLRYPMQGGYRVSSSFNLRRLHPVTQRITPHHGADFAMPIGTPILSVGDGVVTRIGNHPFAGKYIEITHSVKFKTRYLHLSDIQVKQGQQISRGNRVALSGNTGRSTGPHLHFELHINGRPVDPLKADIPTASGVRPGEMLAFTSIVKTRDATMENETLLASSSVAGGHDI